jgi:TolA-binding protein
MFIGLSSCKTTKKEGEMGWVGKQYHDLTSRFNGYYNADVIYNESLAILEDQYEDNYNQLLPVYPEISIENPESQAQELDRAIEKVAVVSNLHPGSKWVDDCYVMMGKVEYLKQDYESAEETLKYFSENFNPADPNSRVFNATKKEDPNEVRRREQKEKKKVREIERKKEEEQRKEDNKLKKALKEAEEKVKEKVREVKEDKRKFTEDRKKDLADLRKKHKELRDKDKEDYDKELKKLKDEIKDRKEDLTKARQKERENERDRKLKEREEAAKKNDRFAKRKKSEIEAEKKAQELEQQKSAALLSQTEQMQKALDQKEAELEALQSRRAAEKEARLAANTKELEDFNAESDRLEQEFENKEEDIVKQDENRKKAEEEKEAEAVVNPFDEQLAEEDENEEKEDVIKSRDNIGKAGFMKHRPAYAEGQYWLAMTYIERQNFYVADYILKSLAENPSISKDIAKKLPAARAHLYLKQDREDLAPAMLQEAMDVADKKQERARYAFILAQLMEKRGQYAEASKAFESARKMSPAYDMKFNAELANLRTEWLAGLSSMDSSQKRLTKLTKDVKNYDFLDQIYVTKAELFLAEGNKEEAMLAFKEATRYGTSSPQRKAESFYRLASLFYGTDDYVNAKLYYDSTLQVMNEKDDRYGDVKRLNENLASVAQSAMLVAEQDSLLALSNLSEEELEQWALDRYEKEAKDVEDTEVAPKIQKPNTRRPSFSNQTNSGFFAYNARVLEKGKFDFSRKWGDRPLQDNWRRSSEISETLLVDDPEIEVPDDEEIAQQEAIEEMLRDVPIGPAQKKTTEIKLQTAMYELGTGLRNNLDNYEKSNAVLTDYINRFPNSDKLINVYYYLYLNHTDLGNDSEASRYLNYIKSDFPDSDFAKSLDDPTYVESLETDQKKLDDYYEETYRTFDAGNYKLANQMAQQSSEIFGTSHDYVAKLDLISVMSQGAIDGKEFYITELKKFIQKHPNTPETTRASEILRFLRGNQNAFDGELYEEQLANFTRQDDKLHYIIYVLYDCDLAKMKSAKTAIAGYNNKFHKLAKLRMSNIFLNPEDKSQVVLIRSFDNRSKALDYMAIAKRNIANHLKPEEFSYDMFAVTQNNYREVMKQKTTKNYEAFYDIHYLQ